MRSHRRYLNWAGPLMVLLLLLTLPVRAVRAQESGALVNQASFSYTGPDGQTIHSLLTSQMMLVDPRGQVRGCDGALLPDYTGFQVGLYDASSADPATADLHGLLALSPTGAAGTGLPTGVGPNTQNLNPFPLSNAAQGMFSFLLDPSRGQLDPGRAYVLVLSPPSGSAYRQRRVLVVVGARNGVLISYTATSLDGEPIRGMDGQMTSTRTTVVQDAAHTSLSLIALNLGLTDCAARPIQITKSGDRSDAEPGDTVVYRIAVRNGGTLPLASVAVSDTLPVGFDLRADSVRGQTTAGKVDLLTSRQGRVATFTLPAGLSLPAGQTLDIVYAALLTPDALRGDGQNSASVSAQTLMTMGNGQTMAGHVSDGPAVYGVRIKSGLLSDTGTLVGRVFQDFNEDGEQEKGEPGIANVAVLLDDSTLVTTDAEGLFSVATLTPGYHTATLDFRTAPGFVLAPNHRFLERRTPARLFHLEPGGLARISFGLLPRRQ